MNYYIPLSSLEIQSYNHHSYNTTMPVLFYWQAIMYTIEINAQIEQKFI